MEHEWQAGAHQESLKSQARDFPGGPGLSLCSQCRVPGLTPDQGTRSHMLRMLSHFNYVQLFVTLWTVACQAPLSMGFSRQEYWSSLPCPPPEALPNPGTEPMSLVSPALAGSLFTTSATTPQLRVPKVQLKSLHAKTQDPNATTRIEDPVWHHQSEHSQVNKIINEHFLKSQAKKSRDGLEQNGQSWKALRRN